MFDKNILPDIAAKQLNHESGSLNWVGMEKIALPLVIPLSSGTHVRVTAMVDCFVSLNDPNAKGIHMSRLYLGLKSSLAHKVMTDEALSNLLVYMIQSQQGISHAAKLRFTFDLPVERPALLSAEKGYQAYPVDLTVSRKNSILSTTLGLTITYSSTCPCSAALSRQLMAKSLDKAFADNIIYKDALLAWIQSDQGTVATPHSQRSLAYINMRFENGSLPEIDTLIQRFETAIGTPVQTAVKREDEQAFAKLNAENLMFCEDAARRLKASLEALPNVEDYSFKIEHQESLHAHNAVVRDSKFNKTEMRDH